MIHIIGAGVSGLAAATKLADAHMPVRLYEATAHAGGRARSSNHPTLKTIDHGLHFIEGDSPELFAYLTRIGAQGTLARIDHPLAPQRAPILDYLPLLSLLMKRNGHAQEAMEADNILRSGWASRVARLLFHTDLEELNAAATRRVTRRYLKRGKRPRAYMAARSLNESFISPALAHLDYRGAGVYFNHTLKSLERDQGWVNQLSFAKQKVVVDADDIVILAMPSPAVTQLLPEIEISDSMQSAITIHYMIEHREGERVATPRDAAFDLIRYQPKRISISVRLANHLWHGDVDFLAQRLWKQVVTLHPYLDTKMPAHAVWREKYASHSLSTDRRVTLPPLGERLLVAGDWCEATVAGSLESAAASGHRAAERAMDILGPRVYRHQ